MSKLETFDTREELIAACTDRLGRALEGAIAAREKASLAVAGGTTPEPVLKALGMQSGIDWSRVSIVLTDERGGDAPKEARNVSLVTDVLMEGQAAAAQFWPVTEGNWPVSVAYPLDVCLLGMGADGHIASIFAEGEGMDRALTAKGPSVVRTVPDPLPESAPYPRMTLSLPTILSARTLILLFTGEDKRAAYEEAAKGGDSPLARLLAEAGDELTVMSAD